jgi:Ca2+-dependent lipid-binding protein
MAVCGTYYRTSLRRVRRNFRDDINRQMAKKMSDTDHESLEWMNNFLIKFWPIYAPVLADTVVASVDQVLSTSTPAFLDSMRMSFFTLGSKPPRMEYVRSYPKADDDIVLMDWRFSFTPNDTADMTTRQLKNKINPKVILEIRIGKAMISKSMPIIVEDFAFSGLMRVKIKLQIPFPHIDRVEICFLEKPTIDYVCKPIGGDMLGFDINFIPGLEGFIMEQIHANLGPIMYAPNVFPIEVAKMLSGSPVDQAIGVVAVTIHGAQGLKNPDKLAGSPDPYAVVSLNARDALAKTKIIKENANPKWNETKYIIVTSLKDSLTLQLFDYNEFRKDKELGTATFPLENLEQISEHDNEQLEVMSNGKARGIVSADVRFFPVLEGRKLEDGKQEPAPESNTGIARFTVEQAKDLDGTKSLIGQLNPYAVLLLNNREIHTTRKLKRTNNPIWDNGHKEILITDRKSAKLGLVIKEDRELTGGTILGTYQIKLDDMMDLTAKGQEWYNLAGAKTGRAKMSLQWKPVALSGVGTGTGGYVTPIGVMRVHLQNARDLRNVETMGKSDPYVRVLLSGIEKGRTVTFQNNLNPDWDEVIYVPMHNAREKLTLEVMDEENLQRDRSLGLVEVRASDYIRQAENGEYLAHDKKAPIEGGLRQNGKGAIKGTLNYTVSFYPCLNIADPEEEEAEGKKESKEKSAAEAGRLSSLENGKPAEKKDAVQAENEKKADNNIDPALQKKLAEGEKEQNEIGDEKTLPKIRLTPEELVKHECGLIIFKLLDAELIRSNVLVEVCVDDMAYPSFISSTVRSRKVNIDEIGDCFVRELDFSKLTIRLRDSGDKKASLGGGDEKTHHYVAKLTGNTLDTLKQCLVSAPDFQPKRESNHVQNNPTTLKLKDSEGQISTIKVSLKYIPVKMDLDPSESINNMGSLRVDVLDGKDLPSADRNGFSDPFCKFELHGQTVFKTQVQKKTLQPTWNEFFEVEIASRTAAKFHCKVWDWDFASEPDFLGAAAINLELLEPFKPQEYVLALDGKSGSIRLRLLFKSAYVTRSRQGSSTFSGTFAAPGKIVTGVAGAPIKGVGMAAHGVGKGASFIKHGFKSKHSVNGSVSSVPAEDTPVANSDTLDPPKAIPGVISEENLTPQTPDGAALTDSPHSRTKSATANSLYSTTGSPAAGTANFTIVSASGYPPSSNVMVFVKQLPGKKVIYKTKHIKSPTGQVKFEESFNCNCSADTQFQVQVKGHATFGSDDDLGEALFFVDESGTSQEKTLNAGSGTVVVKSNFVLAENGAQDSPKGGLRKNFLHKKDNGRNSRDVTPTPTLP